MNWINFEDVKPPVGHFCLCLGQGWLWWGFYNPEREDSRPENTPVYWIEIPAFPFMPAKKVEEENAISPPDAHLESQDLKENDLCEKD